MRLFHLVLRSFRNLADQELDVPAEGLALVAPNAQGKTNLLEAIYYLEILRSFRGAADRQLVRFGSEHFRIEGGVRTQREEAPFPGDRTDRRVAAAWQRQGTRKKVTLDGVEPERLSDAIGQLGVVLFSPSDLALVTEGPHERRRFLDIVLSLNEQGYVGALQRFRQVLAQRNAALRNGPGVREAAAWNGLLVREGARITYLRGKWLSASQEEFARVHREISGGVSAVLTYEPSVSGRGGGSLPPNETELAEAYARALHDTKEREASQGVTVVGPHRDEVRFQVGSGDDALDVRTYGSGGQRRSVALALRLLEADTVRRRKGREPILLMDDVFAELDDERSQRVLGLLDRTAVGQVILTAPKESDVRFRRDRLVRWSIRDGKVLT